MPVEKPNIILVTTDQQRWDTCGPAAPGWMRTPHFDLLCRQGMRFDAAYADCPICVPARVSIMNGQYSHTHGMAYNGSSSDVLGREGTLPSRLRELGYQTCAVGKMHFSPQRTRHGFDEMILPDDYYREMARSGSRAQPMRHGLGQNELDPAMATVPEAETLTSWIAERCVDYILDRRDPTVPFFLWCSFSKPHPPLDPPEPYYSMYRDCEMPAPALGGWREPGRVPPAFEAYQVAREHDRLPADLVRAAWAAYLGLVTQCDYNMGRIFQALQDKGLFDEALIVYTSDHGEMLGDHRAAAKVFFHEGAAHVPAVVRPPRSSEPRMPGAVVTDVVTHADVLPTLVAAAGGEVGAEVEGLDMIGLAAGRVEPRRCLEASVTTGGEAIYHAVTDGRWKYIWYPEGARELLFDLASDPREENDLSSAGDHDAKLGEMRSEMTGRLEARGSALVDGGELVTRPVVEIDEKELRSRGWPGLHTERCDLDVRH